MGSTITLRKKLLFFKHDHFLKDWVKKFDKTGKAFPIKVEYVMRGDTHLLRLVDSNERKEYVGLKAD